MVPSNHNNANFYFYPGEQSLILFGENLLLLIDRHAETTSSLASILECFDELCSSEIVSKFILITYSLYFTLNSKSLFSFIDRKLNKLLKYWQSDYFNFLNVKINSFCKQTMILISLLFFLSACQ